MFGKAPKNPDRRCGVIVDIGSASIATAIVVSDTDQESPEVIWSQVDRCPITPTLETSELAKRLTSTLTTNMLALGSMGLTSLTNHDSDLTVTDMQVTIGAPWTYTVPKRIRTSFEAPTEITEDLIDDLVKTADDTMMQTFGSMDIFAELGLEQIHSDITNFTLNDYAVTQAYGHEAKTLTVTRLLSVCQKQLVDAIREMHEKIVPKTKLNINAFIHNLHHFPVLAQAGERSYGLIDLSGEATEVGIVLDGQLINVIHAPFGHYAAARILSETGYQPLEGSLGSLQSTNNTAVLRVYSQKVLETISRAAMDAELPKHFYVHCDTGYHDLAYAVVHDAVAQLGAQAPGVSVISNKVLQHIATNESRLALSLAVFHTDEQ